MPKFRGIHAISLFIVAFGLLTLFSNCHKDNKTNVVSTPTPTQTDTTYIDSVTSTGTYYAGDIITFSFHIKGTGTVGITSMYWTFGDGSTSSMKGIYVPHIYTSPGTYTVTVVINGGAPLTQTISIGAYPLASTYTALMDGTRRWSGYGAGMVKEFNLYATGSSSLVIDTLIQIQVMNPGVIQFPSFFQTGVTLNLLQDDTAGQVLTFKGCNNPAITVRYYYAIDSIVYTDFWSYGHGSESLVIHTP